MSNYYDILGVSKDASEDEIRNAYRRLARQHHPDKGGDKNKFQKIQEAYETLSDTSKRNTYDNPVQDNPFGFGFDHPFFRHHHQHHQQQTIKKNDHYYICKITLAEVFSGIKKKLKISRTKICRVCISNCTGCNGNGINIKHIQMGPFTQVLQETCNICRGTGQKTNTNTTCNNCHTKGSTTEEKILEIDIKPGIPNGEKFTFEEWGEQASKNNEISGSFVVTISVEKHPVFRRQGLDLLCNIPLTFPESIVGKEVTLPYFTGDMILDTRGFGLINPNKEYIVYNKGLVDANGTWGCMRIKFMIDYPERTFDDYDRYVLQDAFNKVNLK